MKTTSRQRPASAEERICVVSHMCEHFGTYLYEALSNTNTRVEPAEELSRVCKILWFADLTMVHDSSSTTYLRLVMPDMPTTILQGRTYWFTMTADKTVNRCDHPPFDLPGQREGSIIRGRHLTKGEKDKLFDLVISEYEQWFANHFGMDTKDNAIFDYDRMSIIGGFTRDVHTLVIPRYFGNADGVFLISHADVEVGISQGLHVFKLFDDGHIERAYVPQPDKKQLVDVPSSNLDEIC
jgi:hypothetical protein